MNSFWYILLLGVVLSLDAITVGITNGVVESGMRMRKVFMIAFFYGAFQFLMPVVGYYASSLLEVFIKEISHWVSFAFLLIVGGKMVFDGIKEMILKEDKREGEAKAKLTVGKLALQAVATSIDALAVGVSMLACAAEGNLFANVWIDGALIGCTTFLLCFGAVLLGKYAGSKIAVPSLAQPVGGVVLILLGVKILLQGLGVIDIGF